MSSSIIKLNLKNNLIADEENLSFLSNLSDLKYLNLNNNPIQVKDINKYKELIKEYLSFISSLDNDEDFEDLGSNFQGDLSASTYRFNNINLESDRPQTSRTQKEFNQTIGNNFNNISNSTISSSFNMSSQACQNGLKQGLNTSTDFYKKQSSGDNILNNINEGKMMRTSTIFENELSQSQIKTNLNNNTIQGFKSILKTSRKNNDNEECEANLSMNMTSRSNMNNSFLHSSTINNNNNKPWHSPDKKYDFTINNNTSDKNSPIRAKSPLVLGNSTLRPIIKKDNPIELATFRKSREDEIQIEVKNKLDKSKMRRSQLSELESGRRLLINNNKNSSAVKVCLNLINKFIYLIL
jgi:hypothetical protein